MNINQHNHGFSMVEMIIVVAIMAILATLTTPALMQFMQKRDEQTERNTLLDIEKALRSYQQANNELPSDDNTNNPGNQTWAELLAEFTNLSVVALETDTWGNPRVYIAYEDTTTFLDSTVTISYVTVHSAGVNRDAENESGIALGALVNGSVSFASESNNSWWKNRASPIVEFGTVEVGGDDHLLKYTNYSQVIDNYNTTLERLKEISQALESYSQGKYVEALVYDNSLPPASQDANLMNRIYYPRSRPQSGGGSDSAWYSSFVTTDMSLFSFGGDNRVANTTNNTTRRNEMIQLMRLLGLPDSYCCNAMERFTSGSDSFEVPFYYYSNPRPRLGAGCGTRPGTTDTHLPARLSTSSTNICG